MARILVAAALGAVGALSQISAGMHWPTESGSSSRVSRINLPLNLGTVSQRAAYSYPLKVDNVVSTVEGFLLQSPLVTTFGKIVLVTDDMDIALMPDPSTLAPGAAWVPTFYMDSATDFKPLPLAKPGDYVFAGSYLDDDDIIYLVDARNRAIRAIQLSATLGFVELPFSPLYFNSSFRFTLRGTVSLSIVEDPTGDQLWIPVSGQLGRTDGIAIVLSTSVFTGSNVPPLFVPLPDGCVYPQDQGSATLTGRLDSQDSVTGVLILGMQDCGAVASHVDMNARTVGTMWSSPSQAYLFERQGEHAHPVYDPVSKNIYFLDYSIRLGAPQQLCCQSVADWGYCKGWTNVCENIPAESYDPETELFTEWDWLAISVSTDGIVYLAASGYTVFNLRDTHTMLASFNGASGALLAKHRFDTDMFNSAPLLITQSSGAGRLYMSSTKGGMYCYSVDSIASGPIWSTMGEIGRIPDEELPESTYSYLTVTASGTLLVTGPAPGDLWSTEKYVYAITNGVFTPPTTATSGLSTGAVAGIAVTSVAVVGAALVVAYTRVSSFRSAIDGATNAVRSNIPGMSSYKGVGTDSRNSLVASQGFSSTGGYNAGSL